MKSNSTWVLLCTALLSGSYLSSGCSEIKQAGNRVAAATQPPVQISLRPFLVFNGYYVNVTNTSDSKTLQNIVVTYTGASGNSKTQTIATLKPGEVQSLDPSDISWTVEKHETISVSASGYISKTLETNVLIK